MKYWWPAILLVVSILSTLEALAVQKEEGIVRIPSHHSVDQTVDTAEDHSAIQRSEVVRPYRSQRRSRKGRAKKCPRPSF